MTRKVQSKLLKLVCKRAELMRTPYRGAAVAGSSWTSKTSQTNKKSLSVNKTEENFQFIKSNTTKNGEKVVSNSEGMCYRKIYLIFNNFPTNDYYSFSLRRNGSLSNMFKQHQQSFYG
jgi:hypothetical protein